LTFEKRPHIDVVDDGDNDDGDDADYDPQFGHTCRPNLLRLHRSCEVGSSTALGGATAHETAMKLEDVLTPLNLIQARATRRQCELMHALVQ
jgi:hypothetical protein